MAKKLPIFPKVQNRRSMLHIDNLTEFIRLVIDNEDAGIFCPQNKDYVNTSDMVKVISDIHEKKIYQMKLFNPIIKKLTKVNLVNKVFGNLSYDSKMSRYKDNYQIRNFKETIYYTSN